MQSYYLDTTFRQPYQSRRWQFCAIASVLVVLLLSLDWLDSRSLLVSHAQSAYFKVSSTRHVKFYIYELPDAMSKDVWSNPTKASWLTTTSEYDGDVWVYHALANSPFRTYDPDEASLFYIPIFPTQYKYQLAGGNYSWREVETRTTQQVREAISLISSQYPHWNRTKGRDHFLTITGRPLDLSGVVRTPVENKWSAGDEGRCAAFRGMKADEFGEMFVIQHHGDLVAFHKWMPHYGDSSSTITQEDAWPCYRPDRDIILPTYLPEKDVPPHPVRGTSSRNTSVLYSFQAGGFASQKAFRNVRVRNELRRYYEMDPPLDSAWPSKRNISETIDDMARSVFCATPPGLVAHTSRFYRAIQRGCIPIHFMR